MVQPIMHRPVTGRDGKKKKKKTRRYLSFRLITEAFNEDTLGISS